MIGFLFIYWIWKAFANLAEENDKNKWLYFFIGIASYYGGTIIAGFGVGIFSVMMGLGVEDDDFINPAWNIFFILFGGLTCYGVYKLLEYRGEKERELLEKDEIEDIGINNEI